MTSSNTKKNDDDDSLTGFFFLLGGGRLTGAQDFFSCGAGGVGLAGLFSCRAVVSGALGPKYGRSMYYVVRRIRFSVAACLADPSTSESLVSLAAVQAGDV